MLDVLDFAVLCLRETNPQSRRSAVMNKTGATAHSPSGSRFLVLLTALLQIVTPALPGLGFGEPIGSQSDAVRTLITPAGWAFSIWGALYTGSLVFAVYQLLASNRDNRLLRQIRMPAAGAFLGNAAWAAYVQLYGLSFVSTIIIVFTLLNLLAILARLAAWDEGFTVGDRWCIVLPLCALSSWLTTATIVNLAASLRFHGVDAGPAAPVIAGAIVIAGGIIAAQALLRTQGNPPFAVVFLWALGAIFAAGGQREGIVAAAVVIAAVLVLLATIRGLRNGGMAHYFGGSSSLAADGARAATVRR